MKEISKNPHIIRLLLLIGVAGLLLLATQQSAMTASAALPPRPTPSPTPIPTTTPGPTAGTTTLATNGGIIQLWVSFAPSLHSDMTNWQAQHRTVKSRLQENPHLRWDAAHWQTLWTLVQWQDHQGNWHDVEGWQGLLDELMNAQGYKSWWVAPGDLGRGPFRWAIYKSEGGTLLHTSEPFNLPATSGERLTIEAPIEW